MSAAESDARDLDLTGIEQRLRTLNPGYSAIHVQAPTHAGAAVRVIIETTRAELARTGGQLHLTDPALDGLKIETTLRFLDQQPHERIKVQLRRDR